MVTICSGEEAHWTPFQIESVNYIREIYPNWATDGRDLDGAGLVAFMLGVTSHYIADINWHGLEVIPSGEGIIRAMGYADFNCTDGDLCGTAHSAADTGGEFAAAASLDLMWYPQVISFSHPSPSPHCLPPCPAFTLLIDSYATGGLVCPHRGLGEHIRQDEFPGRRTSRGTPVDQRVRCPLLRRFVETIFITSSWECCMPLTDLPPLTSPVLSYRQLRRVSFW